MVFSSMTFLPLFLPLVTILYYLFRSIRLRNSILLLASLLFYAWGEPKWIIVMLLTVGVNYLCGLAISASESPAKRRICMVIGVSISLAFLFFFKYVGFFLETFAKIFGLSVSFAAPTLPIGISFYTFQVLTYTVDVYRRKVPVQQSFFRLLLYVSFFPQLIAGPIVNYTDIAASLEKREHSLEDVYQGLIRFFIGLGKKILLANPCGVIVDTLAAQSLSFGGAWLMILAFAFQIYFDFSGYSDMAIGMGRMFGFHFLENFNDPYISKSVTEFWRRWHISLGTFFREYVYIPLGGNRVNTIRHIRNIAVVWLLTGFWHGASWNFLLWGVYYGLLLLAEKFLFFRIRQKLPDTLNWCLTMLAVLIGWVLFYYENLPDGLHHLAAMFGLSGAPLTDPHAIYQFKYNLVILLACILVCLNWKSLLRRSFTVFRIDGTAAMQFLRPIAATVLLVLSIGMLITQSYNPFLYFRF